MKDSKVVNTRISLGMYSDLEKHSDKINKQFSSILRDALYRYMDSKDDIELQEINQNVIERSSTYEKAFNEQRYRELENRVITETLMKNTFIEFMDNFLAQVYITNKPYKDNESLKTIMRDSLKSLKERAKHSDELSAFQERKETPIAYAEEFMDRKATEEKAFEDSDFDVRIG